MKIRSSEFYQTSNERTRTYRKKTKRWLKQNRAHNKRLISKYPWLRAVSAWSMTPIKDPKFDYCSVWDDLPRGWLRAFGTMMCDELEEEFEKYNAQNKLYVEQAKEKYGGMRLYMPTVGKAQDIIDKYEKISENVCCKCGRPHVPCLNLSWVSPYCKNCFEKLQKNNEYFYRGEYEKYTPENKEHWKIPEKIRWRKYSKEEGEQIEEIDISDTVRKIERIWNERHPDRANEWCT